MRCACVQAAPRLALPQCFIASFKYINLKKVSMKNQRLKENVHQYTKINLQKLKSILATLADVLSNDL